MIDNGKERAARLVADSSCGTVGKNWAAWAREAVPLLKEIAEGRRPKLYQFTLGSITLAPSDKLQSFNIAGGEPLPDWTVASTTLVYGGVILPDGRTALVVRPL